MFVSVTPFTSHLNNGKTTTWYWPQSLNFQSAYYISSQAHHIDELLFFMDWCYTDEGAFTNNYGKRGETYEVNEKTGLPYLPRNCGSQNGPKVPPAARTLGSPNTASTNCALRRI